MSPARLIISLDRKSKRPKPSPDASSVFSTLQAKELIHHRLSHTLKSNANANAGPPHSKKTSSVLWFISRQTYDSSFDFLNLEESFASHITKNSHLHDGCKAEKEMLRINQYYERLIQVKEIQIAEKIELALKEHQEWARNHGLYSLFMFIF